MKELISKEKINDTRKKGFRPVVSACIIHNHKLLILYKKEHKLWQLPQGGIDNKEDIIDALKREISEEINIKLANSLFDFDLVGDNKATFPLKTQNSRELKTDEDQEIYMIGKKYFFVYAQTLESNIELQDSEFSEYKWVSYDEALQLASKIYQKSKQRITIYIIKKLKRNNFIK